MFESYKEVKKGLVSRHQSECATALQSAPTSHKLKFTLINIQEET